MNRASNKFGAVVSALAMTAALVGVVAGAPPAGATGPTTVVVGAGDVTGVHATTAAQQWAPEDTDANTGTYGFVSGPSGQPGGVGSLAMSVTNTQHQWLVNESYGFCAASGFPTCSDVGTKLADITSLSYQTYRTSGGQMPTLNIEVSPPGDGSGYTTFAYVPNSATYANNTWQTWDPFGDTGARWFSSRSNVAMPPGGGNLFNCVSQSAGCRGSWAQVVASYPNARILLGIGPNIGTGGTFVGNVDNFTVGVSGNDTVYDFEPDCTTTCYVDSASGSDFNTGRSGDPVATITAGITKVSSGGTVQVAAGTYLENVTVTKPLTLAGAGQTSTIIKPSVVGPNPPSCGSICAGASSVVLVSANDVTIHDIGVNGDNPALSSGNPAIGGADIDARNGIITNHPAGTFNNLSVHDVTVKNIYLRGIYASSNGTFNFTDNTVDNVQADPASIGIFAWVGPGVISGNHVSHTNDAISANHSKGTSFTNNVITTSGSGIHSDNGGDGGGSADTISGNNVSACTPGGYGVWTFVPHIAPTISNNTVSGCNVGLAVISSCAISGVGACPGSVVPTVSFTGNSVTSSTGDTGMYITTNSFGFGDGSVKVTGDHNVFTGGDDGVYVEETGGQTSTVTLTKNAMQGMTGNGVNNAGATVVDATCNWWGNASGPSGSGPGSGVGVTANVTFAPWLTTNNLNGSCAQPTVSISPTQFDLVEGSAGKHIVNVPVTLSSAYGGTVTVHYESTAGTAKAPADFTYVYGTATFAPGTTTANIPVEIKGDKGAEDYQSFTLTISAPTNATLGNATETVQILNDDLPVVAGKSASAKEGDNLNFSVFLKQRYYQTIVVHYETIDGLATAPGDYTATSGNLTFNAGNVNPQAVVVATHTGDGQENAEPMVLRLSSASVKRTPVNVKGNIKGNKT